MTDSKSVGSNTVRVRPPPSAPKSVTPLNEWGYTFCVLVGGRTRNLRVVQGCTIAVAQSRCTMQRPKRPQTQGCVIVLAQSFARCETNRASTIRQPRPATLSLAHQAGYYFWCGGRENPQLAGKARMPYKMNAQSFKQGCLKSAAQSRYARMHKDSHTEPLHDATAQMAVIAQMQRHKWLSMHRCGNPNG